MARSAKKKVISIEDLSSVNSRLTPGIYHVKVADVHGHKVNVSGLMWTFEVVDGPDKGAKTRPHFTSAEGPGRYRLKNLLRALQFDMPSGDFDLDLEDLMDSELFIELTDKEYTRDDGTVGTGTEIVGYLSEKEAEAMNDEPKKTSKAKPAEDDEEEEEKPKRTRKAKPEPEPEEDEEEEDEEEEKPARKSKADKKKKPALTEDMVNEMDTSELEEFVEEHELDVDISKFRTLSKQRAAVIKAAGDLIG